eukprot:Clim_evm196s157 gene=Clim_evmTU196s157
MVIANKIEQNATRWVSGVATRIGKQLDGNKAAQRVLFSDWNKFRDNFVKICADCPLGEEYAVYLKEHEEEFYNLFVAKVLGSFQEGRDTERAFVSGKIPLGLRNGRSALYTQSNALLTSPAARKRFHRSLWLGQKLKSSRDNWEGRELLDSCDTLSEVVSPFLRSARSEDNMRAMLTACNEWLQRQDEAEEKDEGTSKGSGFVTAKALRKILYIFEAARAQWARQDQLDQGTILQLSSLLSYYIERVLASASRKEAEILPAILAFTTRNDVWMAARSLLQISYGSVEKVWLKEKVRTPFLMVLTSNIRRMTPSNDEETLLRLCCILVAKLIIGTPGAPKSEIGFEPMSAAMKHTPSQSLIDMMSEKSGLALPSSAPSEVVEQLVETMTWSSLSVLLDFAGHMSDMANEDQGTVSDGLGVDAGDDLGVIMDTHGADLEENHPTRRKHSEEDAEDDDGEEQDEMALDASGNGADQTMTADGEKVVKKRKTRTAK